MSATTTPIAIGLGSNLGDREATLTTAVQALEGVVSEIKVGGLYESAAWVVDEVANESALGGASGGASGGDEATGSPRYLNSALVGRTCLSSQPLLAVLKFLELRAGRRRGQRWGPRPLDLDLLLYGDTLDHSAELTLPHPELTRRPFVLAPLSDVAPELRLPPEDETVATLLSRLDISDLERLEWSEPRAGADSMAACYPPPAIRGS